MTCLVLDCLIYAMLWNNGIERLDIKPLFPTLFSIANFDSSEISKRRSLKI